MTGNTFLEKNGQGILLSLSLGAVALIAEKFMPPALNGILLALILGIVLGNAIKIPAHIEVGVGYASSKMLELSILFLAVGINYADVAALGVQPFLGVAAVVFAVLFLSFFLSKRFNCPGNTGILVGFGTAICGSSAIAALAPSLQKQNKEDVAIAMAVINLLGTLGMLVLPWALLQVDWPSQDVASSAMGYLVGGSLHSVGNVAGAGFAIGKSAGEVAITVKLARVALLTPGLIFMTYLTQRHSQGSWKRYFQLPWYLVGFILVTLMVSVIDIPKPALKEVEYIGKVILTIAMAAIGLKVSVNKLMQAGSRGLRFGVVMFLLQIALLGLVMLVMR
jgi:uncharacterized integral membrane protein (TIGR00698 family)